MASRTALHRSREQGQELNTFSEQTHKQIVFTVYTSIKIKIYSFGWSTNE